MKEGSFSFSVTHLVYLAPFVPAILLSAFFIFLSLRLSRSILTEEDKPVQSFLFGVSVYLAPAFLFEFLVSKILFPRIVSGSMAALSNEVSLFLILNLLVSSKYVYIGLFFCIYFLIKRSRNFIPSGTPLVTAPKAISGFRYSFICIVSLYFLYLSGAVTALAVTLSKPGLCKFENDAVAKALCSRKAYTAILTTGNVKEKPEWASFTESNFKIDKTEYKYMGGLTDINGKLSYIYTDKDNKKGLFYDGESLGQSYVSILGFPLSIDGKLAYIGVKDGKTIIVWDGKEYGDKYDSALFPVYAGGTLTYLARAGEDRANRKQILVSNDKEVETDFDIITQLISVKEQISYLGEKDGKEYVVTGGRQYGPFDDVAWLRGDYHKVIAKVKNASSSFYLVDGEEVGNVTKPSTLSDTFTMIDGKLGYQVQNNNKFTVMYDGKEVGLGGATWGASGPYDVNGKVAYIAQNQDKSSSLVVGGEVVGPAIFDEIKKVRVSGAGRIALEASSISTSTIYVDGKIACEESLYGCALYGFFDEKLLYKTEVRTPLGDVSALWYDGKKVDQSLRTYGEAELVAGKLHISTQESVPKGLSNHSLLIEQ